MLASYDDYLRQQEQQARLALALGCADPNDGLERCPQCGDREYPHLFDEWDGQRMCCRCAQLEREYAALSLLGELSYTPLGKSK